MENKSQRLTDIKNIIRNKQVNSQEELLNSLISLGYNITQATLSRDLKLLKVAKMPDGNKAYRYVLPNAIAPEQIQSRNYKNNLEGFLSIEFSGNIGVIKTIPAFSHTIAAAIDSSSLKPLVGTIAGNDTIMLIVRDGYTPTSLKKALLKEFPDLIDKLL